MSVTSSPTNETSSECRHEKSDSILEHQGPSTNRKKKTHQKKSDSDTKRKTQRKNTNGGRTLRVVMDRTSRGPPAVHLNAPKTP